LIQDHIQSHVQRVKGHILTDLAHLLLIKAVYTQNLSSHWVKQTGNASIYFMLT